jgi:hypothetical protein
MKIYLAGPMRGYPNFNFPAFDMAAKKLREQGHEVFSPADHDRKTIGAEVEINPTGDENVAAATHGFSIRKAMGADLAWIAHHSDAVALLPGWEKSTGATAERATAIAIGLTIIILGKEYYDADYKG